VPAWYQEPFTFWEAVFNGLIGAPLFGKASLNPPLWSIQVELIGSILLFAMLALFGRKAPLLLLGWFLFFANVLGYASPNMLYYFAFLAGALLNLALGWLRRHQAVSLGLFTLGLVGVGFSYSAVFAPLHGLTLPRFQPLGPDFNAIPRIFWHTLGSILLVAGTLGSRPIGMVLSARPLLFLGRVSFAMYLIHMPLLMSLGLWVARQAQKSGFAYAPAAGLAFLGYLACVLLLSAAFQRWVDAPAIRLAGWAAARSRSSRPANLDLAPLGGAATEDMERLLAERSRKTGGGPLQPA
jgi:peptidoglycan/LPS O-acetylase OafA/YrhL